MSIMSVRRCGKESSTSPTSDPATPPQPPGMPHWQRNLTTSLPISRLIHQWSAHRSCHPSTARPSLCRHRK
ncbi:hypothetical protein ILYODFUR_010987 [Ilyodon furcidens]|uniref:Uncharacterized protein n=1 Tax=Ilyodon furcidens TaxID=33524 RepID=A0ABV0USP3_9TELE